MPTYQSPGSRPTDSLSRRAFLRGVSETLSLSALVAISILPAGCGGGSSGARSADGSPTPSPSPPAATVVLPQEYAFAYNIPSDGADLVAVAGNGDVLTTRSFYDRGREDYAGMIRHTNFGRPGETAVSVVNPLLGQTMYSPPEFCISPRNEVYIVGTFVDASFGADTVVVLSTSGNLLRTIEIPPLDFSANQIEVGASGDIYRTGQQGVIRYGPDGRFKNAVLTTTEDADGFPAPTYTACAVSPGEEVWSYIGNAFVTAKADGSDRRMIRVKPEPVQSPYLFTRIDTEGNLYIDSRMAFGYPNLIQGEDGPILDSRPYIRKFAPDGTLLAAIPLTSNVGISDFDVDAAGNVYVPASEGIRVYQRTR